MQKILFFIFSCFSFFTLGVFVNSQIENTQSETKIVALEKREAGYTFINPLLECEYMNNQSTDQLATIKKSVEKIIKQKTNQHISVYYRDLLGGPWYGYHEDEQFAPQSLFKLPVSIAVMKVSESDPDFFQKKVAYNEKIESNIIPEKSLQLGQQYSVEDLLFRTLVYSDNISYNLLVDQIETDLLRKIHDDLSIPYPDSATPVDFISVKQYSSLFRILYNSSYLNRENSEYLLSLLSKAEYSEGLVTDLPTDLLIAHKYGVRNIQGEYEKQLHDCGIIYHPKHPYLLCVMTKGNDGLELTKTIQEISKEVFEQIERED